MSVPMYGYRRVPEGLRAVWAARLIAPNDLLHDRQDLVADDQRAKEQLVAWLNGDPAGSGVLAELRSRLAGWPLRDVDEEFTIYEDALGKVVGNTQASFGYVYVAAWLHAHEPPRLASPRVSTIIHDEAT